MICSVCGSDDIYEESSYRNWKGEVIIVFDCRECGYFDHIELLSVLRAKKLNKILKK